MNQAPSFARWPSKRSSRQRWPANQKTEPRSKPKALLPKRRTRLTAWRNDWASRQENEREEKPSQNDHCTLERTSGFRTGETATECVAIYFLLLLK